MSSTSQERVQRYPLAQQGRNRQSQRLGWGYL